MELPYSTPGTTSIEKKTSRISGKATIASVISLIRVKQWVKNFFLFIPSFFSGSLFVLPEMKALAIAFFAFSFVASGVYILNDYQDRELDKLHPKKKFRPIASGEINAFMAWTLVVVFVGAGISISRIATGSRMFL
jgi:decaprenyl-phosphate phosphoribosyltransferase